MLVTVWMIRMIRLTILVFSSDLIINDYTRVQSSRLSIKLMGRSFSTVITTKVRALLSTNVSSTINYISVDNEIRYFSKRAAINYVFNCFASLLFVEIYFTFQLFRSEV